MMAVGKSTIGRLLSKKLNLPFEDLDEKIKNKESLSIKDIFSFKGEDYFRKIEEIECLKIIQDTGKIIAFGGGTFMNETVRNKMKNTCFTIWLDLSPKKIFDRIKSNKDRPLLSNVKTIEEVDDIYLRRKKVYSLANYKIDCSSKTKEIIISEIENIYENIKN